MIRSLMILAAFLSVAVLCATPYGRALKQARKVAGQGGGDAFRQVWIQMDEVLKQNLASIYKFNSLIMILAYKIFTVKEHFE